MIDLIKVRQSLADDHVVDIPAAIRTQIDEAGFTLKPGASMAIGVGSRGIAGLEETVATVVDLVKVRGGVPFIVPAMGSHGGATDEGQQEVLAAYGITEQRVGAPIRSAMSTVELPRGNAPCRVFMDANAFAADGIIVINRVKSHTDFHGPHESGLVKMLVIGLGKQGQALEIHRNGVRGLRDFVPEVAREILATGKLLLGIGLVENAHHKLATIRAVKPGEFHRQDHELLEISRDLSPRIPIDEIDVLIVDQLGKDISGTGMDTNVIGRLGIPGQAEPPAPRIKSIVACGLTPASHGNAIGMGLADVITKELSDSVDLEATAENVMTSTFLSRGKMPIVATTAARAFDWAVRTCGPIEEQRLRVVRIRDTLALDKMLVSKAAWEEIRALPTIRRDDGGGQPAFTEAGELCPF